MKFEKLKVWNKQHNIKGLVKICIICILIIYFIISILNLIEKYTYFLEETKTDKEQFESNIADFERSTLYNYREMNKKEIIGFLKLNDYLEEHSEFSDVSKEDFNAIKRIVEEEMYEKKLSIKNIKDNFIEMKDNKISKYYNNSNYSKETFLSILDIIEIELEYDVSTIDIRLKMMRNFKEQHGYDSQSIINELNNNSFEIFSDEQFSIYLLYSMKYPYAIAYIEKNAENLVETITCFVGSVILGIIIGFNIYSFYNIKKIKNLIIIDSILIALFVIAEFVFCVNGISINYLDKGMRNVFDVPFVNSYSNLAVCISFIFTIAMIIKNRQQIKSLNRINNSK